MRSGPEAWDDLSRLLARIDPDLFVVVVDGGLPDEVVEPTMARAARVARSVVLRCPTSEAQKTIVTLDRLAARALEDGATRRSCVIALGGGLAGNVAGLLAALLFRGIRFAHVPTTLLAMSDSVLSLKQAVNSRVGKNHLGTFHSPQFVWSNLDFLRPLPKREVRAALCELVKNTLAIRPDRYTEVARLLDPQVRYDDGEYRRLIELSVEAKLDVMVDDAFEKRRALILEYGHTVGHAIELASDGTVPHGFAVGLGMLVAARISRELGVMSSSDERAHLELLERNGALTRIPSSIDESLVLDFVGRDNKRGYLPRTDGACDMVLLERLGQPLGSRDGPLTPVPQELVAASFSALSAGRSE